MAVLLLPPSESLSSQVSIESRYGTTSPLRRPFAAGRRFGSARAAITRPSVVSDLLMLLPSRKRAPVASVDLARSLPARSIRFKTPGPQTRTTFNAWQSEQALDALQHVPGLESAQQHCNVGQQITECSQRSGGRRTVHRLTGGGAVADDGQHEDHVGA